ncbi:hypothetical protein ACFQ88_24370 [Paenibacillus sp. NPDC056579]|uniref:hypothetical protein n=1 Tax=Paenibacillus sp. NPDC056579 TaxID=3345871 RepID=UPI0036CABEB6
MKRNRLYRGFRELTSEIHLHSAAIDRKPVIVFHGEELIGSGVIEEITDVSIKIKGERYMRQACKFVHAK